MPNRRAATAEHRRLQESLDRSQNWKRWGPYLSERQWGTVREDYSNDGECWSYLTFDDARSRAYRWGEDGLLGITDRKCRLCFSLTMWNGQDSILKERLFGLTGPEGNHGEDVKEQYYYVDSTPTHSYMRALYKYPQQAFPYTQLREETLRRTAHDPEYELIDTGIFNDNRYFDVQVEYAKNTPDDVLIRVTVANRGATSAEFHLLPTLWLRNTWSWGRQGEGYTTKPNMHVRDGHIFAEQQRLGSFVLAAEKIHLLRRPLTLFTENETNFHRLFGGENETPYTKDAFHEYVVSKNHAAVNPNQEGTKAAYYYKTTVGAHAEKVFRLRLCSADSQPEQFFDANFDAVFEERIAESAEYFSTILPDTCSDEQQAIMQQAYAGLLWNKQFYYYSVKEWFEGDPSQPVPDDNRKKIRNNDWPHLYNRDVISMPDKWEYPWYAAWDLAFHCVSLCRVDPDFAKDQLLLLFREWYMHPNGQIPAYEFTFSDVNPPVHAWACWRVYKMTAPKGERDTLFLKRAFHKLLLNFTWWINQKDIHGKNIFSGGFLGLDNIGVFDRSRPLPIRGHLEQADATAWMAFYCGTMLSIALELARDDSSYEDVASKFFEHFIAITDAMNSLGGTGLWDEQDSFYYDQVHTDHETIPLRIRSLVGLIPLTAVEILDDRVVDALPDFKKRMEWFLENRKDLSHYVTYLDHTGPDCQGHRLLAVPSLKRLRKILHYLLDEDEFLSPFGIRSLSRIHEPSPFTMMVEDREYRVDYVPGESTSQLFGGNSNWRGPVWFPVNYLLIEALERYHYFYGETLEVEFPTGSGQLMNLKQVALELCRRLVALFQETEDGTRPYQDADRIFAKDEHWHDLLLYYEHFHGETGRGLGASHQTGWTALVAQCMEKLKAAAEKP